ncbi:hypothetical protein [aff. Roholtiella sp. LEGE 12411]|uniref:hypothetical protein n=1 Tax=aff. Roholtiella sp. LEGE 12411 TaxID=1828822 RepID=UPI0030D9A038
MLYEIFECFLIWKSLSEILEVCALQNVGFLLQAGKLEVTRVHSEGDAGVSASGKYFSPVL